MDDSRKDNALAARAALGEQNGEPQPSIWDILEMLCQRVEALESYTRELDFALASVLDGRLFWHVPPRYSNH